MTTHPWVLLSQKSKDQITDGERACIGAVISASVRTHKKFTMEQIFDEMLGNYNYLFAHCDPLPRGPSAPTGEKKG